MSLYSDYIRETNHKKVIEAEYGFVVFKVIGQECYIADAYVRPEDRRKGKIKELLDAVREHAQTHKCKYLTCNVVIDSANPTLSIQAQIKNGFKILKADQQSIYMVQELCKQQVV